MITPGRITRAVEAVNAGKVTLWAGLYYVKSQHADITYEVRVTPKSNWCSCPWSDHQDPGDWSDPCWHSLAAAMVAEIEIPDHAEEDMFEIPEDPFEGLGVQMEDWP